MSDDYTMRQAADVVYSLLQQALSEPTERHREELLYVIRHYVLQGYFFSLAPDRVVVTKKEITYAHTREA
jgi:hypothetical protein